MVIEAKIGRPNTSNGKDVELGTYDQTHLGARLRNNQTELRLITLGNGQLMVISPTGNDYVEVVIKPVRDRQNKTAPDVANPYLAMIVARLSSQHHGIKIDRDVLAGTPHIEGTRLSVAHILAELYHAGNIDAVAKKYRRLINARQIKEAIAYAHDFLEMACDLSEAND